MERFISHILKHDRGTLIIPIAKDADDYLLARFIGKVALEALAKRALEIEGGLDEITDKEELDGLRNYVRRGHAQKKVWAFHKRQIYENGYGNFEVLHEYTFLYTDAQELYFVIALSGIEYAMNMGIAEIDGYLKWLKQHDNESLLYP